MELKDVKELVLLEIDDDLSEKELKKIDYYIKRSKSSLFDYLKVNDNNYLKYFDEWSIIDVLVDMVLSQYYNDCSISNSNIASHSAKSTTITYKDNTNTTKDITEKYNLRPIFLFY